jgi:hypothetical protein
MIIKLEKMLATVVLMLTLVAAARVTPPTLHRSCKVEDAYCGTAIKRLVMLDAVTTDATLSINELAFAMLLEPRSVVEIKYWDGVLEGRVAKEVEL